MGLYQGCVVGISKHNDYAFIKRDTVKRRDGTEDEELNWVQSDLFLHAHENHSIGNGILPHWLDGRLVTFDLDFQANRRNGEPLVYGAQQL